MSLQTWGVIVLSWGMGVWFALALCKAAARGERRERDNENRGR